MHKILFADDDKVFQKVLVPCFQTFGYEVITVENGKEAVQKEEEIRPDMVILDVGMPVMDGFEACWTIREKRQGLDYIPILFLSGSMTEGIIIKGLEMGADDFILKPFEPLELAARVRNLLKMKDFISQVELLENTIFSLVKSIETRDQYTAGHSRRVSQFAMFIGGQMDLPEEEISILRKSALLHDIGKIGVPDQILNKPGKCTAEEFDSIKQHPANGEEICRSLRLDPRVLSIIRHHHEKLDGSGYPDGLQGDKIDRLTRIITVADIFDALTNFRPYRKSRHNEQEAIMILKHEAETGKIDPAVVNIIAKTSMPGGADSPPAIRL